MGKDIALSDLLPAFNSLLKDMEGEVRSAAAGKIQGNVINFCSQRFDFFVILCIDESYFLHFISMEFFADLVSS